MEYGYSSWGNPLPMRRHSLLLTPAYLPAYTYFTTSHEYRTTVTISAGQLHPFVCVAS
jgi:hypothetical protein